MKRRSSSQHGLPKGISRRTLRARESQCLSRTGGSGGTDAIVNVEPPGPPRRPTTSNPIGPVVPDQLSSALASLRIDRDVPQPPSALRRLVVPVIIVGILGAGALFGYQRLQGELFKQEVKTTEVA